MNDNGVKDLAAQQEILLPASTDQAKRQQWLKAFTLPQVKSRPMARAMAAALQHRDGELLKDLIYSAIKHAIDGDAKFFEMIVERIDGKLLAQATGTGLTVEELEAASNPLEKAEMIVKRVRERLAGKEQVM